MLDCNELCVKGESVVQMKLSDGLVVSRVKEKKQEGAMINVFSSDLM